MASAVTLMLLILWFAQSLVPCLDTLVSYLGTFVACRGTNVSQRDTTPYALPSP